jgi:putative ABC transport system permease protein
MLNDLRHAVRVLAKNRAVTVLAVLALGLGIGANTAIFSVVNAVLLHPLPYRDADRLVTILEPGNAPVAPADLLDVRAQAQSFEHVGAAEAWGASLTSGDAPERVVGLHLSEDLFATLGVPAVRGRTFDAADFEPGRNRVLVISNGFWQRRFGGADSAIGSSVVLDGESYTIIGVMPAGFRFAPFWITQAEMWAPLDLSARLHDRAGESLRGFARLKPGASIVTAQSELDQISHALEAAFPATNARRRLVADSLVEKSVGNVRPALEVLLGAVGLVLLIACANVAGLALARATARQREIAIRLSLGAQRVRIVRQFLTESVLLALVGGAAGLLLAAWGVQVLTDVFQPDAGASRARLAGAESIGIDFSVLAFTMLLALVAGVISGLAPALAAVRGQVSGALKEGGRSSTASAGGTRTRRALVAAEIAIALVLLTGAGLLTRSFVQLRAIEPGFDPHDLLTVTVSVANRAEYTGPARETLYRSIEERAAAVPGVTNVAMVNHVPITGDMWGARLSVEGRPIPERGREESAVWRVSRPGYFAAMGARLLRGRDFEVRDAAGAPPVVIVNEALVRRQFPNEDAVGKRITMGDPRGTPKWMTIVGVIRNMRQGSWRDAPQPEMYIPFAQSGDFVDSTKSHFAAMTLVVRTGPDAAALARAVKEAVWAIDRNLPLSNVETFDHAIGNATWESRSSLLLMGVFSAVALALAMIGIYGVMAYEVAQRTGEIGVRMALGASPSGVLRMILGHSLPVAIGGIVCGLALALGLVRLMRTMLFGVEAFDPLTFGAASFLVLVVAIAAALIPARRAMRVDPVVALRSE